MTLKDIRGQGRRIMWIRRSRKNMLDVVNSDSRITVRNVFNVAGKSYGTVKGVLKNI